jgi:hypothetical protein
VLAAAGLMPAAASAATTASATAKAAIVRPLTLVKTEDLRFGGIIAGTTAGTVKIGPDGTVTSTGGATPVGTARGPARFYGYGTFNEIISLRISSNTINIKHTPGNQQMQVSNFTISSTPPTTLSTNPTNFRIGAADGLFGFDVGATLHVGANQAQGVYTGNFTLTVQYF